MVDWLVKWKVPVKSARAVCSGGFSFLKDQVAAAALLEKSAAGYNRADATGGFPVECESVIISGPIGTGRTTLAAYLLKQYADKGMRAASYVTMDRVLACFTDRKVSRLLAPMVLVIDDFSMTGGVGKFAPSVMGLLSSRASMGKPTCLVTAHSRAQMKHWADGNFGSWAAGNCVYVELSGADINKTLKQKAIAKKMRKSRVRTKKQTR